MIGCPLIADVLLHQFMTSTRLSRAFISPCRPQAQSRTRSILLPFSCPLHFVATITALFQTLHGYLPLRPCSHMETNTSYLKDWARQGTVLLETYQADVGTIWCISRVKFHDASICDTCASMGVGKTRLRLRLFKDHRANERSET